LEDHAKRWNILASHSAKEGPLGKVIVPSKPSKNKSLVGFKEAIIKYKCLVSDSEKEKWKMYILHSDNLRCL
jgi:hypothetical protein